jgi:fructose-specific component phosphotransferase system IIB-like protein
VKGATLTDAATNTLTNVLTLTHLSSGTAAAGYSTGLLFRGQNSAGAQMDIAGISANEAGVAPGSEKGGLDLWVRTGGSALAKKWQLSGSGNWVVDTDNAYTIASNTLRLASANAVSFRVHAAAGDANRVAEVSTFGVGLGKGGATAMDWFLAHSATALRSDMATGNILGAVGAGGFACRTATADVNPTSILSGSTLLLGAGGASAGDVRIRRTAAKTLTLDDGAGGAITVVGVGGGALQPNVVPDLLTAGMPAVGSWWVNLPKYGSGNMFELTIIGYVFAAYGGGSASFTSGRIQFTSLALANQGCGWSQATSETDLSCRPWMRGRVKVGGTAADQGVWIGWVAGGALSGVGSVSNNTVALSCETVTIPDGGKGQTTWQVTSKETGAVDYVDTLVPYTAGHDYETYLAVNGADVVWAIYDHTSSTAYGGTCVAKANMPVSSTGLGVLYTGISGVAGAALVLTWGACTRGFFGPA